MGDYYLAVDIGASGGRHMLGWIEDGNICTEEIYRFGNGMREKNGHLFWDLDKLFQEIVTGLSICRSRGKIPSRMGIDTWAVDYVLLDKDGNMLGDAYGYRDHRTNGMDAKIDEIIPPQELYERTGIQSQIYNTIYQLMAVKEQEPENMQQAQRMLSLPDYFNYLLTGIKMTEYTIATATQLFSPWTKDWDYELIEKLGYKRGIFGPVTMAGTKVGRLKKEIEDTVGFNLNVMQVAAHDTASAVIAVPAEKEAAVYISSGTWSLMGVEREEVNSSQESRLAGMTNEGGYEYRYRYLKNITGLWMIQCVRQEYDNKYSYAELCNMAEKCRDFPSRVNVNDPVFFAPDHMTEEIRNYCRDSGQKVPEEIGEVAAVIYQSLADSYAETVREIEKLTGRTYASINIVGGGANVDYLNQLTANKTNKTVYSGPTEATAIGNLLVQMIENGEFESLEEARAAVLRSFPPKYFQVSKRNEQEEFAK